MLYYSIDKSRRRTLTLLTKQVESVFYAKNQRDRR